MAHTSRMENSDKCATEGFTAVRKDFTDSLTGQYVDITFKVMGLFTGLFVLMATAVSGYLYYLGQINALKNSLTVMGISFVPLYLLGYRWVYRNVYDPVHDISTRLLAEQKAIDAWPDDEEVEGKDVLRWQYAEIEKLLQSIITLQEQVDLISELELNNKKLDEEVEGKFGERFDEMVNRLQLLERQAVSIGKLDLADEILEEEIGGQVGEAFNSMAKNLEEFVQRLQGTAGDVRTVGQELAEGAEETSSSLEETSASVEEMASMTEKSSENARAGAKLAEEAVEVAKDGQKQIDRMAESVQRINEDSEQIAEAIDVIDDIAFQTNLLALNAAVEAANAGEHGAGFAVVADEVRDLAQRSAEAAEEITEVIEKSRERTKDGVQQAQKSREALEEIRNKVEEVTERVREISSASEEQSTGIEEINRAINELETVSEKLNSQAGSLQDAVLSLNDLVDRFEVEAETPTKETRPPRNKRSSDDPPREATKSNGDHKNSRSSNGPSDPEEDLIPLEDDQGDF